MNLDNKKEGSLIIFLDRGESLSPFDIINAASRLSLSPKVIMRTGRDIDKRYARVLGARAISTDELFNTGVGSGSIVITERPLGVLAALRLSLPAYFYSGSRELCELSALLCPPSKLGRMLIPYHRGRADAIASPVIFSHEFRETRRWLDREINALVDVIFK